MQQLTGQDAMFLYLDKPHAGTHGLLVYIYDQSTAPGGVLRYRDIVRHVESHLHHAPYFRKRLLRVPLELDFPYLVDDEQFDINYHMRHIALPKPGDWRQFCIQASRIVARPLDLSRPLWEMYVVEGLDNVDFLPKGSFATGRSKTVSKAIGARELTDITKHSPAPTMMLASKLLLQGNFGGSPRMPFHNCCISNVPGPQFPLYLAGAKLAFFSVVAPLTDGLTLFFAVTSYDGKLFITVTSTPESVPDPEFLTRCLRNSFDEANRAARAQRGKAGAKRRAPARKRVAAKQAAGKPRARSRRKSGAQTTT
jgi:hypothetical protein